MPDNFGLEEQTLSAARHGRDIPEQTRAEIITKCAARSCAARCGDRSVSDGRRVSDADL
jgi:hypothetical protein